MRLQSFTEDPAAIARYGGLGDATDARRFSIKSMRHVRDNVFVAKVAGVADRESAASLTNVELYLPRAELPAPDPDEFYRADLIGLAALDEARAPLGRIVDVLDFGGGEILEIAPAGGGDTLLFPFTRAVVPEIDVADGWLVIVAPREIAGERADETALDESADEGRAAAGPA